MMMTMMHASTVSHGQPNNKMPPNGPQRHDKNTNNNVQ